MLYYSTNHTSPKADFKEATIRGQAPDKGLYFPENIPQLPKSFIKNINSFSKEEIAYMVIQPYVGNVIPKNELKRIISETINFDFPVILTINILSADHTSHLFEYSAFSFSVILLLFRVKEQLVV